MVTADQELERGENLNGVAVGKLDQSLDHHVCKFNEPGK